MGKRELILIAAFVIVGAVVYQITAPPPAPGERSFSVGRLVDNLKREVGGNRASAQMTNRSTQAIDPSIEELRLVLRSGAITIIGEDRDDAESELQIRSTAYDQAEAEATAKDTVVLFEPAGSILFVRVSYPPGGRQYTNLSLKVPSRLRIQVEDNRGTLKVENVAAIEVGLARGDTTVSQVAGRAVVSHRGGELVVNDCGSLRLTIRGSDARVERIRGELTVDGQAGELTVADVSGPIEIDSNAVDVTIDGDKTSDLVRIDASGGDVTVKGLRSEGRIDLRNAALELSMARASTVAINSEGGEPVTVTVPDEGFRVDAVSRGGQLTAVPEGQLAAWGLTANGGEGEQVQRVTGGIAGGGPPLAIRAEGDIVLKVR